MKWETKIVKTKNFSPFSLTLTFETKEEYVHFHDNVMPNICPKVISNPMYGAIYRMGEGFDRLSSEGYIYAPLDKEGE